MESIVRSNPSDRLDGPVRSTNWRWIVCGLLLLASTINYMDRQTLANVSVRVTKELTLKQEEYGNLELAFGLAFAFGSAFFGWLADRTSVRALYPFVLFAWSLAGAATGWTTDYQGLIWCRLLLGFFEAGHWPCALKTTQLLLEPKERTLGNSVLQSGTSIGAVITPLIIRVLLTDQPGSWRKPFVVVGALGLFWVIAWLLLIRKNELTQPKGTNTTIQQPNSSYLDVIFDYRFVQLLLVVACINISWHLVRVWMPKFLQEGRGYTENFTFYFLAGFYVMTDVGCLLAGGATVWLHRQGKSALVSRKIVFFVCSAFTALGALTPWLPNGLGLLAVLCLVGAGLLGLFPCYYTFTQELSVAHQGKVTGALSFFAWVVTSPTHTLFGRFLDNAGSFEKGIALASLLPLLSALVVWFIWRERKHMN